MNNLADNPESRYEIQKSFNIIIIKQKNKQFVNMMELLSDESLVYFGEYLSERALIISGLYKIVSRLHSRLPLNAESIKIFSEISEIIFQFSYQAAVFIIIIFLGNISTEKVILQWRTKIFKKPNWKENKWQRNRRLFKAILQ